MKYHTGLNKPTAEEIEALNQQLIRTQGSPLFGDVAPHLKGFGADKDRVLLFPYTEKLSPGIFSKYNQQTGDCTSFGTARAVDIARSVEILLKKEPEEWVADCATEPIYAARGHGGQGMSVTRAVKLVNENGFLVRKDYGFEDFTNYKASKGANLGGRSYPQQWKDAMGPHKMRYAARLTDPEQIFDSLAAGYGIVFGGFNYQISNKRDSRGVSRLTGGSWSHSQTVGSFDKTSASEPLLWICNSWGAWNGGGHPDYIQLPAGSAFVPMSDFMSRIWPSKEIFAIGDSVGFPAKELPDYGTSEWL